MSAPAILPSSPDNVRRRPFHIISPEGAFWNIDAILDSPIEEVICIGPLRNGDEITGFVRRNPEPRGLARSRIYACRAERGGYIMLWRVAHGRPRPTGNWDAPPRKLAHWDTLEAGVGMMLCPTPDDVALDEAVGRAARMKAGRRGHFQPFFDDSGALWVARLPTVP